MDSIDFMALYQVIRKIFCKKCFIGVGLHTG